MRRAAVAELFGSENLPENSEDLIDEALEAALVTDAGAFLRPKRSRANVTNVIAVGVNVVDLFNGLRLRCEAYGAAIGRLALFGAGRVFHGEQNELMRRFRGFFLRDCDYTANRALFALGQARL